MRSITDDSISGFRRYKSVIEKCDVVLLARASLCPFTFALRLKLGKHVFSRNRCGKTEGVRTSLKVRESEKTRLTIVWPPLLALSYAGTGNDAARAGREIGARRSESTSRQTFGPAL